jgi:hypothetical protein
MIFASEIILSIQEKAKIRKIRLLKVVGLSLDSRVALRWKVV